MAVTMVTADFDRIEKLLDVIEACARVRMASCIPISALAMRELEDHGEAANAELKALIAVEEEAAAAEATKAKAEADAIRKKEEEANTAPQYKGEVAGSVRRDLPPLSAPPAR